jgi:hypothetical protein
MPPVSILAVIVRLQVVEGDVDPSRPIDPQGDLSREKKWGTRPLTYSYMGI